MMYGALTFVRKKVSMSLFIPLYHIIQKFRSRVQGWVRMWWLPEHHSEMEKLQRLSFLLHSGYPASARVIEVIGYDELFRSAVGDVDLILDLQMPGRRGWCRVRTSTMLARQRVPGVGEMISVRYLPTDTSFVLVL